MNNGSTTYGISSDGCSGGLSKGWRLITGEDSPFDSCCRDHDREYTIGGNSDDRFAADLDLFKCVHEIDPIWSYIIFFAVRIFGSMNCFWKWKQYEYKIKL